MAAEVETLALPDGRQLALHTCEACGTGGELWAAAHALCRWQCNEAASIKNARVLELGSGIGAGGLFAAALGAHSVLLTDEDRPRLLQNLKLNVERNAALFDGMAGHVEVNVLNWGNDYAPPAGPWDWVLGSDLTYSASGTQLLCQTVYQLLTAADEAKRPRVILAHQDRPEVRGGYDGSLRALTDHAEESGLALAEILVDPEPSWDLGYATPMVIVELTLAAAAPAPSPEDAAATWYPRPPDE